MERKFDITMHAPLGLRHGTMIFTEKNNNISGTLELLAGKNNFTGTITENGTIEFSGKIASKLHSFTYIAKGRIIQSKLEIDVTGNRYSFCITGEEIKPKEEEDMNELY